MYPEDPYNPNGMNRPLSDIDRDLELLTREREQALMAAAQQLDAPTQSLVFMAGEIGTLKSVVYQQAREIKDLKDINKSLNETVELLKNVDSQRDSWKNRALVAEDAVEKAKTAARNKRKRSRK